MVKGHDKEAHGPRDLSVRTAGDTVTPIRIPLSPRGKAPIYWSPCLAVATDHVKHARGLQDLTSITVVDSVTSKAAPQMPPRIRFTSAHPIYPRHPSPDAARTPNTSAQGWTLASVPPGRRIKDTLNPQGSLVSREGTPHEGIPPTAGGNTHPDQPRSLSGPGGPDRATDSLVGTRSHPAFIITR